MPDYDGVHFQPPAPVAHVVVQSVDRSRRQADVRMLLDSGADVTLLPRAVAVALQLELLPRRYELVGYDGRGNEAEAVNAILELEGRVYRGQFLLIDDDCGILGRNILNTIVLTLDGPRLAWR